MKKIKQLIYLLKPEYRIACLFVLVTLIGLLEFFLTPKLSPVSAPKFTRQFFGLWNYQADIPTANLTASLGISKNQARIEIARNESILQMVIPLENPKIRAEKNQLIYTIPEKQVETRYQLIEKGLKEEIVLNKKPPSGELISEINLKNLIVKITPEGIPVFFDSQTDEYQFHFQKPFAKDAKGNVTYDIELELIPVFKNTLSPLPTVPLKNPNETRVKDQIKKELLGVAKATEIQVEKYQLALRLDQEWLADPQRVYPVIIDPTVVHDTSAEFATGTFNRVIDNGSGSSPYLEDYYQELLTDINTQGFYHFSNGMCAADDSGKGYTLTANGGMTCSSGGRFGYKASGFATTPVSYSQATLMDLALTSGIIEAWINPSNLTATQTIFYADSTNDTLLTLGTSGQINLRTSASTNLATGNNLVSTSIWTHVAATWTSTGHKIYINGVEQATDTNTTTHTSQDYTSYIGVGAGGNTNPFSGSIDELRISAVARAPEEIKLDAQRRPYAVYTSDVIDLTAVSSWNSLSWTESGVQTGDGETLYSSTSLTAQWNFNEGVGASATVAAGSCGSSCQGTLTGFSNTTGEDVVAGSGWTENNKRWGGSALMFDGSDDYVNIPYNSNMNFGTGNFGIDFWIKTSQGGQYPTLISRTDDEWGVFLRSGNIHFYTPTKGNVAFTTGTVNDGNWHYVVVTRSGTTLTMYIDGLSGYSNSTWNDDITSTAALRFGYDGANTKFIGIIDSTRIYSRALEASEILSSYQAGQIEFQTRSGSTSSPPGGWEVWTPINNETPIDSMDGPYQYNTTDSGLVSYWPMDENVDNSCSGGTNDACDKKGSNDGAATGTKIVDGKWGKARYFNGSSDYIGATGYTYSTFTVSAWVKASQTISNWAGIVEFTDASGNRRGIGINNANGYALATYGSLKFKVGSKKVDDGQWHHITGGYDGSNAFLYVDGIQDTLGSEQSAGAGTASITRIGSYAVGTLYPFPGIIDEARISNTALSASTILQNYQEGIEQLGLLSGSLTATTSGNLTASGSGSMKVTLGAPTIDGNTVALWHMEETSSGATDIKDSTSNANNSTSVTGTTVVDGFYGKARLFDDSDDYIEAADHSSLDLSTNGTVEAWIKTNANEANNWFLCKNGNYCLGVNATGALLFTGASAQDNGGTTLLAGQWHHVAVTNNNTTATYYVDGASAGTDAVGWGTTLTNTLRIGRDGSTNYFDGLVDEIRISNVVRTAEEIAEAYRAGRDHRIGRAISADLSSKVKVPFYIAADRPGTYLETTIGESTYANYEPDVNAVGLWHLEEKSGSGAYIKDSSGKGNHSTPSNTTFTQGKIGKGRYFTSSVAQTWINLGASNKYSGTTVTIDMWFNSPATTSYRQSFISNYDGGAFVTGDIMIQICETSCGISGGDGKIIFEDALTSSQDIIGPVITDGRWHHLAVTYDNTNRKTYLDGVFIHSRSTSGTVFNTSSALKLGEMIYTSYPARPLTGYLDEVRISNSARSADYIRQAFEIGKRTHQITIDFATTGLSSNLLTNSSDYEFAVATTSGLFKYDKVIVKENYGGTEYIAQGEVSAINTTTRTVTVTAWDTGSTFPSGGYTANCTVFKWQREYFDITGSLPTHRDGSTRLTMRIIDGSAGANIWLDDFRHASAYLTTAGGDTITSAAQRYFQYRAIFSTTDTAATSSAITSVTVNYNSNTAPNTPTLDSPSNGATGQSTTPALKTTATDDQSDYLRYKIQVCTNQGMTENCQTFDQTSSQTGWSGQNAESGTAYTSGTQATYTVQTPLSAGTTYYWRSYAIDPGGTNTWSSTQGTPYSFTTITPPSSPAIQNYKYFDNAKINDTTPVFNFKSTDADSDDLEYEIQIDDDSNFGSLNLVAESSTSSGFLNTETSDPHPFNQNQTISFTVQGGDALTNGTTYWYRLRARDPSGSNTWSSWMTKRSLTIDTSLTRDVWFQTTKDQFDTDTLTGNAQTNAGGYVEVSSTTGTVTSTAIYYDGFSGAKKWQYLQFADDETYGDIKYSVYYDVSGTPTIVPETVLPGNSAGFDTSPVDISGLPTNHYPILYVKATLTYSGGTPKLNDWTVSAYDLQEPFLCNLSEGTGSLTLTWEDKSNDEDHFYIQRKVNTGAWTWINSPVANSTSYTDTSVANENTYQYRVRGETNSGDPLTSWCETAPLVWGNQNLTIKGGVRLEKINIRFK